MKVKRALISVSDKTDLEGFVKGLNEIGVEIMSTGGTAKVIAAFGVPVTEVSAYTGFPEMLEGRVKTLHPKIHAGLLARRDKSEHMKQLEESGILPIDMVVVNLYPFEKTVSHKNVKEEDAIENIDIGGPAMLRSAAKNFEAVAVISSSSQYDDILSKLKKNEGMLDRMTLKFLAAEVFNVTSRYDGMITDYLSGKILDKTVVNESFSDEINISIKKKYDLRYGENPHQKAAFYEDIPCGGGIVTAEQLQGKELSYNNILDLNAAVNIVKDLDAPSVAIVKHNNPCGVAIGKTLEQAYLDALECDRMSAFGGIMGFNKFIDKHTAEVILDQADFIECIIAPGYDDGVVQVFSQKKNLRVLNYPALGKLSSEEKDYKKIPGGMLVQDIDTHVISAKNIKTVTKKEPRKDILEALLFGWKIVKHVKSNAIVLCDGTKTVGIGAGQMSRVDSVVIAVKKAGFKAKGAILASDAFFPKADSIEKAHVAGISAIIQPGGSIRDQEVIDACDKYGISMVLTGVRHFKH